MCTGIKKMDLSRLKKNIFIEKKNSEKFLTDAPPNLEKKSFCFSKIYADMLEFYQKNKLNWVEMKF